MSSNHNRPIFCYYEGTETKYNLNNSNSKEAEPNIYINPIIIKSENNGELENKANLTFCDIDISAAVLAEELKTVPQSDDDDTTHDPISIKSQFDENTNIWNDNDKTNNIHNKEQIFVNEATIEKKTVSKLTSNEPKPENYYKVTKLTEAELENIKLIIKTRLEKGDVKDKDGNLIEADAILNNIDKINKRTFCTIWQSCIVEGPLSPKSIELLSLIQKQYADRYSSLFISKKLATEKEIREEFHKRRLDPNYIQAEYKCTRCFQYFKTEKILEHHIAHLHNASNRHVCRYCAATFTSHIGVQQHEAMHSTAYHCKLCSFLTNNWKTVETHYNAHKGYACEICNEVFESPLCLNKHKNRKHNETNNVCPYCARMYRNKYCFNIHINNMHRDTIDTVGPPSAKCEPCDVQFISDEVFVKHQTKCRFGAPRRDVVKKKKQLLPKRKKREVICRVCKHIEPNMGLLMKHFTTTHPDKMADRQRMALIEPHKYLCHECGKGFNILATYEHHRNTHSGLRPYSCAECPKSFHGRTQLCNHMRFHAPPRYQCAQCGKKFHSSSNLCNHKRIHTNDRRYACEICDKTFLHHAAMVVHKRSVHLHLGQSRKRTIKTTSE